MSTNAVIRIKTKDGQFPVEVYKHWDGYPSATLPWLKKFNESFAKNRGADHEYKLAQLLRSSVRDSAEFELDASEFTGWGVARKGSCGYDYIYYLHDDGVVTVNTVDRTEYIANDGLTVKEAALNFIQENGPVTYSQIIEFMVDRKFGAGTYQSDKKRYRGWYSSYFKEWEYEWSHSKSNFGQRTYNPGPFYNGIGGRVIEKQDDGRYIVINS